MQLQSFEYTLYVRSYELVNNIFLDIHLLLLIDGNKYTHLR